MTTQSISTRNLGYAYFVYLLAAFFLLYIMAVQVSPSVMTEELMRDLNMTAAGLGILSGIFFWTYTICQIPAGLLFDRYSCRWLTSGALFVCVLGALLFVLTTSPMIAALGRLLLGAGSAFAFISVIIVIGRWFPVTKFASLVGITQLIAAVGALGGEVPLSASVAHFGWRTTSVGLVVFGAVLLVLIMTFMRDRPKRGLEQGVTEKVESLSVRLSLLHVVKSLQSWFVGLYAFSNWAPIAVFASLWGVPFLRLAYDFSATQAAVGCGMIWIGLAAVSPFTGWVSDRLGRRKPVLTICALIGLIASCFVLYVDSMPLWALYLWLFVLGAASSGQIISFAVVKDNNPEVVTGTAIGFNNMAVVAGGAVLQPYIGLALNALWDGQLIGGVPAYSLSSYRYAMLVVPACFLIALLVSCFGIRETYCRRQAAG